MAKKTIKIKKIIPGQELFVDISKLIEQSRQHVATTVNSTLTMLY